MSALEEIVPRRTGGVIVLPALAERSQIECRGGDDSANDEDGGDCHCAMRRTKASCRTEDRAFVSVCGGRAGGPAAAGPMAKESPHALKAANGRGRKSGQRRN
jgi:hypothetical protein